MMPRWHLRLHQPSQVGATNAYIVVLTSAYICWSGLAPRVFAGSWADVFTASARRAAADNHGACAA